MKVTGTAVLSFLSLWAAQTAYAHPLASNATLSSDGDVERIVARADSAKCGDHQYSQSDIQNAEGPAVNYIMNNGPRFTGTNKRKYPKIFHNYDNEVDMSRTLCSEPDAVMREFPILRDGQVFGNGLDPAADRIIIGSMDNNGGPRVWSTCGLITHEGAEGNKFVNCS